MGSSQISLARQVEVALEKLGHELLGMNAGTIVIQIRDDAVGRFGIRHLPMDCGVQDQGTTGMTASQVLSLRKKAVEALNRKSNWTHGEISYDFAVRRGQVDVSVQFESNYNMANILFRFSSKGRERKEASSE